MADPIGLPIFGVIKYIQQRLAYPVTAPLNIPRSIAR